MLTVDLLTLVAIWWLTKMKKTNGTNPANGANGTSGASRSLTKWLKIIRLPTFEEGFDGADHDIKHLYYDDCDNVDKLNPGGSTDEKGRRDEIGAGQRQNPWRGSFQAWSRPQVSPSIF